MRNVEIKNVRVKIQLWDQHAYEHMSERLEESFYRSLMHVLCAIFAVDNQASFDFVRANLDNVIPYCSRDCVLVVVANKIDLPQRVVTTEMGRAFADSRSALYYEVSAKTAENIDTMFVDLASRVVEADPHHSPSSWCLLQ
eukprot:TRINITY_DN10375_c0_g1_i2.p1 TRINITY_DN10375_c0_g1~~TRINITY_DN10375_c0_g1_i2.p1  ORF type:complete len:141 (-),score=2.99 TRINITY_DN10375_c0_g1_i2:5-427(-)